MSGIVLTNQTLRAQQLQSQCSIADAQTTAYPYMLNLVGGNNASTGNFAVLNQLTPAPISRELTNISLSLGGDNVLALSEMMARLNEYNVGLMGASTSVYAGRMEGFAKAVKEY